MDLSLNWGSCERQVRREKGVLRAAHPHTPFSSECPPQGVGVYVLGEGCVRHLLQWL